MGKKIGLIITAVLVVCITTLIVLNIGIAESSIKTLTETTIEDNLETYKALIDLKVEQQLLRVNRLAADHMIGDLLGNNLGPEEREAELHAEEIVTENLKAEKGIEEILDNISIINDKRNYCSQC